MVDVLNIAQFDHGTYNVLVEWVGIGGEPRWEPEDISHDVRGKAADCRLVFHGERIVRGTMVWAFERIRVR